MGKIQLDLHGVKHEDAERKVIEIIEENFNQGKLIYIITGNSEKMKEIVKNVLDEYGLKPDALQLSETEIHFRTLNKQPTS